MEKMLLDVDSFVYLGSTVNETGGAGYDIKSSVGKARSPFNKLTIKVWKSSQCIVRNKTRLFNSNVLTVRAKTAPSLQLF